MKVSINITVELDRASWSDGKRIPAEVREDVKSYVLSTVYESAMLREANAEVTVR